jgi:hypothetical protein
MHVKTDVFCSAAVVLPDKFARILNAGGYSGESNFGIRLYAPDGSAGVNGTNDWEEDPGSLELQVGVAGSEPSSLPALLFSKMPPYTGSPLVSDRTRYVQWQCSRGGRRGWSEWPAHPDP